MIQINFLSVLKGVRWTTQSLADFFRKAFLIYESSLDFIVYFIKSSDLAVHQCLSHSLFSKLCRIVDLVMQKVLQFHNHSCKYHLLGLSVSYIKTRVLSNSNIWINSSFRWLSPRKPSFVPYVIFRKDIVKSIVMKLARINFAFQFCFVISFRFYAVDYFM